MSLDPALGYGWALDGRIIGSTLREAGFDVTHINAHFYWGEGLVNDVRARVARELQGFRYRFLKAQNPTRDINIFLERVPHQVFPAARKQILIPNQEWFLPRWMRHLPTFDGVVCKTRVAQETFSKLGCRTYFSSFTSVDKRSDLTGPKKREFFAAIGKRPHLGERLVGLWSKHPEWPQLTLLAHRVESAGGAQNIRLIKTYVSNEEIIQMQNENLFHLAVTSAEGFGHKLNEAMSCGAIVITTDAPPMNELVGPDRGQLVKWNRTSPKALGMDYHFDDADLEQTIEASLRMPDEEVARKSAAARSWFESNDGFFKSTLPDIIRRVHAGERT